MAITTVDGIVAGLVPPRYFLKVGTAHEAIGVLHSHAYATGSPGAIAAPAPGLAGAALTTLDGQIPFTNPVSGNSYLSLLTASSTAVGTLYLVDRLWHNSGIVVTTTTAQTINSAAWPARDQDGSTNGVGVMVGIEVRTATTNAGAITGTVMSYTDQSGNAGAVATMASFPATAAIGTFVPFQLAAGDSGVRSIQTVTLTTSYVAGAIHLVAYRVLAQLPISIANAGQTMDYAALGFPRLYDNTVPMLLWQPTATGAVTLHGTVGWAQG